MKILGQHLGTKDLTHVIPRLIIIIILGQTLPSKLIGTEESVYIFKQMNWEPWGRYLILSVETLAIALLLSHYYILGAIITLSIISAANFMHITRLGLIVKGDGGTLFIFSVIVILMSLWLVIHWNRMRTQKGTVDFDFDQKKNKI